MRFVQLIFSPTGGVKRAAELLSAPMAEQPDIIDLSLPLNGTPRFSPEDVCLIAVPCFGGRAPEIALERLAQAGTRLLGSLFGLGVHSAPPFRRLVFSIKVDHSPVSF